MKSASDHPEPAKPTLQDRARSLAVNRLMRALAASNLTAQEISLALRGTVYGRAQLRDKLLAELTAEGRIVGRLTVHLHSGARTIEYRMVREGGNET